jgi:integrase
MTLAEFVREEWWPRYAVPNLKPSTQRRYLEVWGAHLLLQLGDYELRAITPTLVDDLRARLDSQRVGVQSQRKALMLLKGILRRDEATRARWCDLTDRTLHVHASKTERARTIKLLSPLAQDLAAWRLVPGRPPSSALIFPTADGDDCKLHDWQHWRRRVCQPAARAAG